MNMLRRLLLLAIALPSLLHAQQQARVAPNVTLTVWYPVPRTLAAFPRWWRDSVRSGLVSSLSDRGAAIVPEPVGGGFAWIKLQILRNGRLYRARIDRSSGIPAVDSALVAAAWHASDAGMLPAFPPGVDGAGREVRLVALLPGVPIVRTDAPQLPPVSAEEFAGVPLPSVPARCDSILAAPNRWYPTVLFTTVDTVSEGAGMKEWGARTVSSLPEAFLPVGQVAPVGRPTLFGQASLGIGSLPGTLHLVVNAAGRLRAASVLITTEVPGLDSALLAFAKRADSLELIPPPASMSGDSATIDLRFDVAPPTLSGWIPLGNLSIGNWELDSMPRLTRIGVPTYPAKERRRGVGGRVTLDFVVGLDGRPVHGSISARATPVPEFVASATKLVADSRYEPGKIRGCAVPVMVRQNVSFSP